MIAIFILAAVVAVGAYFYFQDDTSGLSTPGGGGNSLPKQLE